MIDVIASYFPSGTLTVSTGAHYAPPGLGAMSRWGGVLVRFELRSFFTGVRWEGRGGYKVGGRCRVVRDECLQRMRACETTHACIGSYSPGGGESGGGGALFFFGGVTDFFGGLLVFLLPSRVYRVP